MAGGAVLARGVRGADEVSEALRLELPFPPKGLSPNSRLGWRAKAKLVGQYRESCGWAGKVDMTVQQGGNTLDELDPLDPPVEATVTFVVPDRRRRDLDNLLAMLKPAWDGLCDAQVLAGDDYTQFKGVPGVGGWVVVDKGRSYVIVELSSV